MSEGGMHWDFIDNAGPWQNNHMAAVVTGTETVFNWQNANQCNRIIVDGWYFDIQGPGFYEARPDGRGLRTGTFAVPGTPTRMTREIWVPERGLDTARWIDSITNVGDVPRTVNVQYDCYFNPCGAEDCVAITSDGDGAYDRGDRWWVRQAAGGQRIRVGNLVAGEGADLGPSNVLGAWGQGINEWRVELAPGETKRLMQFVVQGDDTDDVAAALEYIGELPTEVTEDLGLPLPNLENFVTDGRPVVSVGRFRVPEGGEIVLEPRVMDREGDPLLVAWDLNADGIYDDGSDVHQFYNAAGMDGDLELDISLYVVEDIPAGREVFRGGSLDIVNVAPIVASEPPTDARRGGLYTYTPLVIDPAGELDPITLALAEEEFPIGMEISAEGVVTWRPVEADLDPAIHDVHLIVEDDDGGTFDQTWSIEVTDNVAPFAPLPLYPISNEIVRLPQPLFLVSNSTDIDGDPITYHFRMDWDPLFRSSDMQATPDEGLPAGSRGVTEWRPQQPIPDAFVNQQFFWEVWAFDGIDESEHVVGVFTYEPLIQEDAGVDADADTDTDTDTDTATDTDTQIDDGPVADDTGCACRTTSDSASAFGGLGLIGLGLALVFARRRTR